jgi:hypothetical protein
VNPRKIRYECVKYSLETLQESTSERKMKKKNVTKTLFSIVLETVTDEGFGIVSTKSLKACATIYTAKRA